MIDGRHSCWREAEIVSGNKTTKRHCSPARPPATEIDCLLDMFPISILQFTRANFFFLDAVVPGGVLVWCLHLGTM